MIPLYFRDRVLFRIRNYEISLYLRNCIFSIVLMVSDSRCRECEEISLRISSFLHYLFGSFDRETPRYEFKIACLHKSCTVPCAQYTVCEIMKTFPLYFVFFFSLIGLVCPDPWWHHTIIYQIYPRSFQDSDGDGVGDLKGIASRLDYIINIGAKAIWLSPIYESPMKDFGYDISNFKEIDPVFGSLDDFDHLVFEAHNKGIKVILDFVPNHSSDKHDWFIRSELREDPFSDYYVWRDKRGVAPNGDPIPPNNWVRFILEVHIVLVKK